MRESENSLRNGGRHFSSVQEHQAVLWTPEMEAVVCPVACCIAHLPIAVYTDTCGCCGTRLMLIDDEMLETDLPERALLCWSCALSTDVLVATGAAMISEEDAAIAIQRSAARFVACCRRQFGYFPGPSSPLLT